MTHLADDFGRSESGSLSDKSDFLTISVTEAVRIYFFNRFSYSGQILPARFAQEFSLYPALNSPFRRLSKKKMTKNKNFKFLNFDMLRF